MNSNCFRGHSTTTWKELCHCLTPPPTPLCGQFYTLSVYKNRCFLIPFPPHLAHIVIEWPLTNISLQKALQCTVLQFSYSVHCTEWKNFDLAASQGTEKFQKILLIQKLLSSIIMELFCLANIFIRFRKNNQMSMLYLRFYQILKTFMIELIDNKNGRRTS